MFQVGISYKISSVMAITQLHTTPKPYPIAGYWEDKTERQERKKERKTERQERKTDRRNKAVSSHHIHNTPHITQPYMLPYSTDSTVTTH